MAEKLYNGGGLVLPWFVTPERLSELKTFKLLPDDVFVVTYPKCGTTWTLQIIKLIRSNGKQDDTALKHSLPWIEDEEISLDCKNVIKPRGFKSHMTYDRFSLGNPHELPCKFIYVARNPKDVATSFYYHTEVAFFPGIDKETYWSKFVNGELEFGNYFDHVLGWWEHKDDDRVLFLKYEDMKKDLKKCVSEIASFIGADISEEMVAQIASQTTFESMKKNPLANNAWRNEVVSRGKSKTEFMRKGIVGDWKNFLTQEQSAEVDAICASRFTPVGLCFDFE